MWISEDGFLMACPFCFPFVSLITANPRKTKDTLRNVAGHRPRWLLDIHRCTKRRGRENKYYGGREVTMGDRVGQQAYNLQKGTERFITQQATKSPL
jgi:hypothetical protein